MRAISNVFIQYFNNSRLNDLNIICNIARIEIVALTCPLVKCINVVKLFFVLPPPPQPPTPRPISPTLNMEIKLAEITNAPNKSYILYIGCLKKILILKW